MSPPPPQTKKGIDRRTPSDNMSSSSSEGQHNSNNSSSPLEGFISSILAKQGRKQQSEKSSKGGDLSKLPRIPSGPRPLQHKSVDTQRMPMPSVVHDNARTLSKNHDSLNFSNHTATTTSTMTSGLSPAPRSNSSLASGSLSRWDSGSPMPMRLENSPMFQQQHQLHVTGGIHETITPTLHPPLTSGPMPTIAGSSSSSGEKSAAKKMPAVNLKESDVQRRPETATGQPSLPPPPISLGFSPAWSSSSTSSGASSPGQIQTLIRRKTPKTKNKKARSGASSAATVEGQKTGSPIDSSSSSSSKSMSLQDYRKSVKPAGSNKSDAGSTRRKDDQRTHGKNKKKPNTDSSPPTTEDFVTPPARRAMLFRSRSSGSTGPEAKRVDTKDSPPEVEKQKAEVARRRSSGTPKQKQDQMKVSEDESHGGRTPKVTNRKAATSSKKSSEEEPKSSSRHRRTLKSSLASQVVVEESGTARRDDTEDGQEPEGRGWRLTPSRSRSLPLGGNTSANELELSRPVIMRRRRGSHGHHSIGDRATSAGVDDASSSSRSGSISQRIQRMPLTPSRSRSLPLGGNTSTNELELSRPVMRGRRGSHGHFIGDRATSGDVDDASSSSRSGSISQRTQRLPRRGSGRSTDSSSTTASIMERLSFASFREHYRASHSAAGASRSTSIVSGTTSGETNSSRATRRLSSSSMREQRSVEPPGAGQSGGTPAAGPATVLGTSSSTRSSHRQPANAFPTAASTSLHIREQLANLQAPLHPRHEQPNDDSSSRLSLNSQSTDGAASRGSRMNLASYRETAGYLELPISSSPPSSPLISPTSRRMLANLDLSPSSEEDDDDMSVSNPDDMDHL